MAKPSGRKKTGFNRREKITPVRERILIVCEGKKTEPDYFSAMRADYGVRGMNVVIHNTGSRSSPKTVVGDALRYYKADGEDFDAVFCVFDRDRHGRSYSEALGRIGGLEKFFAINSVPCFEFWVLLHFCCSLGSWETYDDLAPDLRKQMPDYKKNMTGLYDRIKDPTDTAIKNAKHAERQAKTAGTDSPTTKVYVLVEKMREMAEAMRR